jgi:hypothetical protein
MELFHSSECYLYNLETTSSSRAKKIWREAIKERWDYECAYCGSKTDITLDHVIPQAFGGLDISSNIVSCCKTCNHDKGHKKWDEWFLKKEFFSENRYNQIIDWIGRKPQKELYTYKVRRNNCT